LLGDEAGLEAELVALIRQSIHVRLQPPQRITGTRCRLRSAVIGGCPRA
jgi:hypothetical protein